LYDHKKKTIILPYWLGGCNEESYEILAGSLDHETWHAREDEEAEKLQVKKPSTFIEETKDSLTANVLNCLEDIRIERKASHQYDGVKRNLDAWRKECRKKLIAQDDVKNTDKFITNIILHSLGDECIRYDMSLRTLSEIKDFCEREIAPVIDDISVSTYKDKMLLLVKKTICFIQKYCNDETSTSDPPPPVSPPCLQLARMLDAPNDLTRSAVAETYIMNRMKTSIQDDINKMLLRAHPQTYFVPPEVLEKDKIVKAEKNVLNFSEAKERIEKTVSALYMKLNFLLKAQSEDEIENEKRAGSVDTRSLYKLSTRERNVFFKRMYGDNKKKKVGLLVDESGSMSFGKKYFFARQAAIAFSETLNQLQMDFCVYGFSNLSDDMIEIEDDLSSSRRVPLTLFEYKSFCEKYSEVKERLGNISARQENSDGDAINWVSQIMLNRFPFEENILFVVSDGAPECLTSDNEIYHLREVLKRLDKKIKIVGVGYMSNYVADFYKDHIIVNNLEDLPQELHKKLSKMLLRK